MRGLLSLWFDLILNFFLLFYIYAYFFAPFNFEKLEITKFLKKKKKKKDRAAWIHIFFTCHTATHDQDANCHVCQDAGLGEVQGRRHGRWRVAEAPGGLIGSPSVSGTEQMSEYIEPLPPCLPVPLLVPLCVCWKSASAHWYSDFCVFNTVCDWGGLGSHRSWLSSIWCESP